MEKEIFEMEIKKEYNYFNKSDCCFDFQSFITSVSNHYFDILDAYGLCFINRSSNLSDYCKFAYFDAPETNF